MHAAMYVHICACRVCVYECHLCMKGHFLAVVGIQDLPNQSNLFLFTMNQQLPRVICYLQLYHAFLIPTEHSRGEA